MGDQSGQDKFTFDVKLGTSRTNHKVNFDTIKDLSTKDDKLWLTNKIFAKLGQKGPGSKPADLNKDFFVTGTKAKNDQLIYTTKTGALSYDADDPDKGQAVAPVRRQAPFVVI